MRTRLIVGNWKMHGDLRDNESRIHALIQNDSSSDSVKRVICVPFPYLAQAKRLLAGSTISLGAQNLSTAELGPFTGEVSAKMLHDFECGFVIVGHSERRIILKEEDADVTKKVKIAINQSITPIVCVGESLSERKLNKTEIRIRDQVDAIISSLNSDEIAKMVFAYEPIWAIGTGETASPAQAQEIHCLIRSEIAQVSADVAELIPILYGGSVKSTNAEALFSMPDIDGGLVGGASLDAKEFNSICACA